MGKAIIDLIGELVEISGNATVDTILFAIIGGLSFAIAFGLVGALFDALGFYDSDIMSDAHWLIRVTVFAGLTYVGVKVAQFIRWLFSFQWWVYVIIGIVLIGIVVLVYYIKHRISKNRAQQIIQPEEPKQEPVVQTEEKGETKPTNTNSRYYCPRCHSRLVKRHGPYGNFYGCEAYGKTGCRYTRKFL